MPVKRSGRSSASDSGLPSDRSVPSDAASEPEVSPDAPDPQPPVASETLANVPASEDPSEPVPTEAESPSSVTVDVTPKAPMSPELQSFEAEILAHKRSGNVRRFEVVFPDRATGVNYLTALAEREKLGRYRLIGGDILEIGGILVKILYPGHADLVKTSAFPRVLYPEKL